MPERIELLVFKHLIAAWLNDSQRSQVGIGMPAGVKGEVLKDDPRDIHYRKKWKVLGRYKVNPAFHCGNWRKPVSD